MRVLSLALLVATVCASAAIHASDSCTVHTEAIYIDKLTLSLSGFSLTSEGEARAVEYSDFGGGLYQTCEWITGEHHIADNNYTIVGADQFRRSGIYQGTLYVSGMQGRCYRARLEARGEVSGHSQARGTPQFCIPSPDWAIEPSYLCPLILDLNGDGLHTTGLADPVRFWDHDGDGINDPTGWTNPATEEAFLWIDLNGDHAVAPEELFGSAMKTPDGDTYRNGFQALALYDSPEYGGDADGAITPTDSIWEALRLWIDRDHSGSSHPSEIAPLPRYRITSLDLARVHDHTVLPDGNSFMLVGSYNRFSIGNDAVARALIDVSFTFE